MPAFALGDFVSFTLDEFDILTIDGQSKLSITPNGHHPYETQTIGHQVVGPFGVTTAITLTGLGAGSYVAGPSNQPLPMVMVDISSAQQASPTAAQLAATSTLYQLNAAPYTIYQSNGSALVAIGAGGSGVTTAAALTDIATINLPTTNAPLAAALAAAGVPAQSISFSTVIPLDTAGNGKYMPATVLNANSVFTVGASPIEQGNCNFSLLGNGSNIPDLSAFVNANSYSYNSAANANNIYTAIHVYSTPLLYGTLGSSVVTVPGQASALTAGAATGTTQPLTWTAPGTGGAPSDYIVEWRTTAGPGSWNTFAHTASTATARTVTGLSIGTSYDYRVTSTNTAGNGVPSSIITASTVAVPNQVTGLTAGTATSSTQPLTWSLPGGGTPTDYLVEFRTTVGPGSWGTFAHGASTTLGQTVTGLAASTSYDYRVSAVNSAGTGTASSTVTAVTAATITTFAADTFDRADSATLGTSSGGQTWVLETGGSSFWPAIVSNRCARNASGFSMAVVDSGHTAYTASLKVKPNGASIPGDGIAFRGSDFANNMAFVFRGSGEVALTKRVSGSPSVITETSGAGYANDGSIEYTLLVTVDGSSNITCQVNGTTVLTATDSAFATSTAVGVMLNSSTSTANDFLVTS